MQAHISHSIPLNFAFSRVRTWVIHRQRLLSLSVFLLRTGYLIYLALWWIAMLRLYASVEIGMTGREDLLLCLDGVKFLAVFWCIEWNCSRLLDFYNSLCPFLNLRYFPKKLEGLIVKMSSPGQCLCSKYSLVPWTLSSSTSFFLRKQSKETAG